MTSAPTGFIAPAQWTPPSLPGTRRSTCWSPASTRASRSTTRWRVIGASPPSIRATAPSSGCCWPRPCAGWARSTRCWRALIERPLDGANAPGRQVLRLGAAQLLFLGTPAHAAVDTSVRLVVDAGLPHLRGLANAVLRRVAREGVALLGDRDPARLNTPQWLWQSWLDAYGEEATRAIAAAHLVEAPLDLTPRANAEFWAGRLDGELLATGTIRRAAGGIVTELPGFAEGAWWVQDAAATLPARLLGDVSRQARRRSLRGARRQDDAALRRRRPGDRRRHLGAAAWRAWRENLARAGLSAELVTADAGKWAPDGKIRRHPARCALLRHRHLAAPSRHRLAEGRRRCRPADARPGSPAAPCDRAAEARRHAGLCRVLAAGGRGSGANRSPPAPGKRPAPPAGDATELPGLADAIVPSGDVRTLPSMWPERGGMDGFYIARISSS